MSECLRREAGCPAYQEGAVGRKAAVRYRAQEREQDEEPSLRVEKRLLGVLRLELLLLGARVVVADGFKGDELFAVGEEGRGRRRIRQPDQDGGADDERKTTHHDVDCR